MSPNKKVTKEVGLGGGAECLTPEAKAALPLRTLSRRALFQLRRLFPAGFLPHYLISYILYLISQQIITFKCYSVLQWLDGKWAGRFFSKTGCDCISCFSVVECRHH